MLRVRLDLKNQEATIISKIKTRLLDEYYGLRTKRFGLRSLLARRPVWTFQPTTLQLDTQNRCSLNCCYCNPQTCYVKDVETRVLDLEVITDFVNQVKRVGFVPNYARPWLNGDPLLEKRLPVITKLLKQKLGCRIDLFTNGVEYVNRSLLCDPNVNDIRFTISANGPESYLKVHGKNRFSDALNTLSWVNKHRFWYQRLYVNFILFDGNVGDLDGWKKRFKDFKQDVRCLHTGADRLASGKLSANADLFQGYYNQFLERLRSTNRPCACFSNLALGVEGNVLQCADTPYRFNWGHVQEVDLMEVWNKRLDVGLNHVACRGCVQKLPEWRVLFEKYVWNR